MFPNISNGSCTIGNYITPKRGKSLLSKNAIFGDVPVIAGGLEPSTYHNVANTQSPVLAISASGANAGYVSLWNIQKKMKNSAASIRSAAISMKLI